jgi:hypothetical protein
MPKIEVRNGRIVITSGHWVNKLELTAEQAAELLKRSEEAVARLRMMAG